MNHVTHGVKLGLHVLVLTETDRKAKRWIKGGCKVLVEFLNPWPSEVSANIIEIIFTA